MKFEKFRIYNYKSIEDSGDCYLSDGVTILAGKNESGKTSILEALCDCGDKNIRETSRPIGVDAEPYIDLFFKLSETEMTNIFAEADLGAYKSQGAVIGIRKQFGDKQYRLLYNSEAIPDNTKKWDDVILNINATLKEVDEHSEIIEITNHHANEYRDILVAAMENEYMGDNDLVTIQKAISIIDEYLSAIPPSDKLLDAFLANYFPHFVLFSSFDDSFPDSISVAALKSNTWARDLEKVSSFKINDISDADHQRQRLHLQKVNAEFSDRFKKYWTQDSISLTVERNGDVVNFWIIENDIPYKPSQRSKGQQWYLSFYVKVLARSKEHDYNVILIDEPGLYLHAKAQKDLMNVLGLHSSEFPIIFSTHSPYLISEENLENIRLVEKHNRRTTVHGKIHSKSDKETLTPILTAIGLGLNDSITNIDQKNNIVVEGPEDTFYLQAFKFLLPDDVTFNSNFINGGGAGNMGMVGTILTGWGCDVLYLYDNDKGKKDGGVCLRNTWAVLSEKIKEVTSVDKSTIADILSNADFKKHVLFNEKLSYKSKNSEYIKTNKEDKVLLARQFLQNVKNSTVTLDSKSKANIKALFEKLVFEKQ